MNIERKLGKIVEPFDQKGGLVLGGRQAKASGVQTRLNSPVRDRKAASRKAQKRT
jgi:hypothetical protein